MAVIVTISARYGTNSIPSFQIESVFFRLKKGKGCSERLIRLMWKLQSRVLDRFLWLWHPVTSHDCLKLDRWLLRRRVDWLLLSG